MIKAVELLKGRPGLEPTSSHSQCHVFLITRYYLPSKSYFVLWQKDWLHKEGTNSETYFGFSKAGVYLPHILINEESGVKSHHRKP